MVGYKLAIQQRKAAKFQARYQPGKRDFGCIPFPREHAFPTKGTANSNPVKPANQPHFFSIFIKPPAFHTMRETPSMQGVKRLFNLCINPGFLPPFCRFRTSGDHLSKGFVAGY